jgi:hypothetical protein
MVGSSKLCFRRSGVLDYTVLRILRYKVEGDEDGRMA